MTDTCEKHCEATAFKIVIRGLEVEVARLKEALAQPEQEPVAWMSPSWIDPDTRGWQSDSFESIPIEGWLPIYTTPPQRTEQEPPKYSFKAHWEKDGRIGVVGAVVRPDGGVHLLQDFIDPPQRTWVGLTEQDLDYLCNLAYTGDEEFALAVQAKLMEKNA